MATALVAGSIPRTRTAARSTFYVAAALLIVAIVLAGFAPSFADMAGGAPRPWIFHLHGVVYLGWLALLVGQAMLAARGRIGLHRKIGAFGVGYGVLVWVIGLIMTFYAPTVHLRGGEWDMETATTFLALPLGDMVLFGGFFAAAVGYRHKPDIHKRLILLASVAIMFAGAYRLSYAVSMPVQLFLWYSPILAGMVYDRIKIGRVHGVYWIGGVAMAVALARIPFSETELWQSFGRALLAPLV